jgi:hypothetical protein
VIKENVNMLIFSQMQMVYSARFGKKTSYI